MGTVFQYSVLISDMFLYRCAYIRQLLYIHIIYIKVCVLIDKMSYFILLIYITNFESIYSLIDNSK